MKTNIRRITTLVLALVFLIASTIIPGSAMESEDQIIKDYYELASAVKPIDGVTVTCSDVLGPHSCLYDSSLLQGAEYHITKTCNDFLFIAYVNKYSDVLAAAGICSPVSSVDELEKIEAQLLSVDELEKIEAQHECSEYVDAEACAHATYMSGCLNSHKYFPLYGWLCERLVRCYEGCSNSVALVECPNA